MFWINIILRVSGWKTHDRVLKKAFYISFPASSSYQFLLKNRINESTGISAIQTISLKIILGLESLWKKL